MLIYFCSIRQSESPGRINVHSRIHFASINNVLLEAIWWFPIIASFYFLFSLPRALGWSWTAHWTLYTEQSTLNTRHRTAHWTLYTEHSTQNCSLSTLHWTLYTEHSTLNTLHITAHWTLYTEHCSLNTLHWTLYTEHSTLKTAWYWKCKRYCILSTRETKLSNMTHTFW